jgi:hypothetical protein
VSEAQKALVDENRAFFMWARENYANHAVGALALAVYMYEACRQSSDTIFWDVMSTFSKEKEWTSQVWLGVAQDVLKAAESLG